MNFSGLLLRLTLLSLTVLCFISGIHAQERAYQKTKTGLRYLLLQTKPSAQKPFTGDVVKLSMIYKNSKDSVLFDNSRGQFDFTHTLSKPAYSGDFNEALSLAGVGDSLTFLIKADSFYLRTIGEKRIPPFVRKGSDLTFFVKVLEIIPQQEFIREQLALFEQQKQQHDKLRQAEKDSLILYLQRNRIDTQPTASGLYVITETEGNGNQPVKGNTITVNYKAFLTDGKVFESTDREPLQFILGKGTIPKGLEEGLLSMRKGGKARLIIPSHLAFGEYQTGTLPPFTTLIYEVELLDIKLP